MPENHRLTIGSLFSGVGGLDLAVEEVLAARTIWHSENDKDASAVLAHHWPDAPNHGDITAINWKTVQPVDVLTGGFPCQDISVAGLRRGIAPGTRSGLWAHMAHAIDRLRPRLVVIENVRGITSMPASSSVEPCPWCLGDPGDGQPAMRALGAVLADLADIGYDAVWHGLRAADVGAPHHRYRVFIIAWPAEDTDLEPRNERWFTASGQAQGWRPRSDSGRRDRTPAADANSVGGRPRRAEQEVRGRIADALEGGSDASSDPDGLSLWAQQEQEPWSDAPAIAPGDSGSAWGRYAAAITRWEHVTGRAAPPPLALTEAGTWRLSATAVEWMMGLPAGWVTGVPGISRAGLLRMLGNGVVPQQAVAGIRVCLQALERAT